MGLVDRPWWTGAGAANTPIAATPNDEGAVTA